MTAREWDKIYSTIRRWFKRSRLRWLALQVAAVILAIALVSYGLDGFDAHVNKYDNDENWNVLRYLGWAKVALAVFALPLANAALLGLRSGTSGVRSAISEAFSNRRELKETRERWREAEALSEAAERETERIQKELDAALMA